MAVVMVVLTAIAWFTYHDVSTGITTSTALEGAPPSIGSDQNILVIGLDSRRDQQGRTLPPDILDAMHAGDESSGSYDADVLIVVHIPAGDGPVTAVSIPRDDYVDLPGCPTADCQGKIKTAYRLAYDEVMSPQSAGETQIFEASDAAPDIATREQEAREAGRRAQITAIKDLLNIPIDHFVEITLGAFFQIARVVEPITVCLNQDTSDHYYSGADFHRGIQQIDAAQAMGFVRQRRDANDVLFTDLDRTRRQQAFMASVVAALRDGDTLSSPTKMRTLLDVAKQNLAIDSGLDLRELIPYASAAINRPVMFYTLPVTEFRTLPDGEDVNIVDEAAMRSMVQGILEPEGPATSPSANNVGVAAHVSATSEPAEHRATLDVVNASGQEGVAAAVQSAQAKRQFDEGEVSTAAEISASSSIAYGAGAQSAAELLADELGLRAVASDAVAPDTVLLTVGTDFQGPSQAAVAATAAGTGAPTPTNLTVMSADGVPCVR